MTEKANADVDHVRVKRMSLRERHVAELVNLADRIATQQGVPLGDVPYPDPDHGGVDASVLFVLTAPSPRSMRSTGGSGLLSLENDDNTAARSHREIDAVGLPWDRLVHWNAVPFPPADGDVPSTREISIGAGWLRQLLPLLPQLRVVVLLGRVPERAWAEAFSVEPQALVRVIGPSPGPRGMAQRGAADRLHSAFVRVAEIVG